MISLGYDHKHWMNTQCPSGPRSRLCELAIGPDGSVVPHNGGDLGQRAHRAGRHRGGTPSFERAPWTVDDLPGVLLLSRMRGRWVMASFLRRSKAREGHAPSLQRGGGTRIRHQVATARAEGRFREIAGFNVFNNRLNIWGPRVVRHVAGAFMSDRRRMTVIFC